MKIYQLILLATIISSSMCSQQTVATNLASRCTLGVPKYNRPLIQDNINNNLLVNINADHVTGIYPDGAIFTGNVYVNHGNSYLQADEVRLYQKQYKDSNEFVWIINALGNVHYDDNQIILKGSKGYMNLNSKDTNIWEGEYQMIGRQGRGKADLIKQYDKSRYIFLENGSFTSCLPGSNTWSIAGRKIIHDRENQVIKVWNALFNLGSIPIFYSPYLQIPIGNKSCSGFLTPNVKYSISKYFEFYLPYYWRIMPNMDVTITPHYIYKLGNIIWENELRYLTNIGIGQIELNYLSSEKVFKDKYPMKSNRYHWLFCWQHTGTLDQIWRFNVDYTKVSNPYYFNKSNFKYQFNTYGYITQKFSVGYMINNFDTTLSIKQFQVFNHELNRNYAAKPQLDINWYKNNIGPFNIHVYAQEVHFISTDANMPESIRTHIEPAISLPIVKNRTSLNTEVKIMATHYQQKKIDWYNTMNSTSLKHSVNRLLPQFKIDGKSIYNRSINWAKGYTQTLESRMQYLYVPYYNHSKIQNYDSSFLQSDYNSLFRDCLYSGLDRITSVNRLTTGFTTHIYDDMAVERLSISIGETYYFPEHHVDNDVVQRKSDNKTNSLVWSGDIYWRINNHWNLRGNLQYNTRLNNMETSNSVVEYQRNNDHVMQLTYRYVSSKYINVILPNFSSSKHDKEGISRIGSVASWPINDRWAIIGSYYFDINNSKTADQMIHIQYNSCCYAIQVGYERKINSYLNTNNDQVKYDNIICFNIELRGLSSNTQQMLHSNIL